MHKSPERLFVEPSSNKCSCGKILHPWRLRYDWCKYRRYTYVCLHLSAGNSDVHLEMLCSSVAFTICSLFSFTHRLLAVCFQAALLAPINVFLIFVYLFILAQHTDDSKGLQQCWKNEFCSVSRSLLLSDLQSFVLINVAVELSSNKHGMSLRLSLSHCHHVMQHKTVSNVLSSMSWRKRGSLSETDTEGCQNVKCDFRVQHSLFITYNKWKPVL